MRVFSNLIVQIFTTAANDLLQAGWWANVAALDAKSGAKIRNETKFLLFSFEIISNLTITSHFLGSYDYYLPQYN